MVIKNEPIKNEPIDITISNQQPIANHTIINEPIANEPIPFINNILI
jgi:hypothetical protein